MEIAKSKELNPLLIIMIAIVMVLSILAVNVDRVYADDIGSGTGGDPTESGVGKWYAHSDPSFNKSTAYGPGNTTQAWKTFVNNQISLGRAKSESGIVSLLNNYVKGTGFALPGGGSEQLYLSCMKSEFIWYYGNSKGRWYVNAGKNAVNEPVMTSTNQINVWETYKSMPGTTWGQDPGPVIVCSGTFTPRDTKPKITLKSNSGTFIYNGEWHTVSGWTQIGGGLKKGHKPVAQAAQSLINVGQMPVKFTEAKIVDANNKDVTSEYILELKLGTIRVIGVAEEDEFRRCVSSGSDSISNIITRNHLRIDPVPISGTISSQVGENGQIYIMNPTDADDLMSLSAMPNVNEPKSNWYSWKNRVTAVGNQRHIDIDLNEIFKGSSSFADLFSRYGGVLDVRINHSKEKASATFCQPQTRTKETYPIYSEPDEDGMFEIIGWGEKYTEWVNEGEEIIQTISNPTADTPERSSYQILGVNCNKEGFITVKNSISSEIDKWSLIESTGSGYIKTKRKALPSDQFQDHISTNFILGYSGLSSQSSFYTEGPTCKDNGLCIVEPGPNGSPNDSHNNTPTAYQSSNALFAHMSDAYANLTPPRFGFPRDKGTSYLNDDEIVFFRDNEERTVRADVWRLKDSNGGWKSTGSQAADRTVVNLFSGATPEIEITTVKLEGHEDSDKLNFGMTELEHHENKFVFKSQWASNEGKPYKLGINWVYSIGAERGIVNVVGGDSVSTGKEIDYIEVACQFKNENTAQNAQINQNPFVRPYLNNGSLNWDENKSVKVLFSRGVSDKRD